MSCGLAAPRILRFTRRPQGGGNAPADDRAVFTAVVYVLASGCAGRHVPGEFGMSPATAHRRFTAWTRAGLWPKLHKAVLDELGRAGRWTGAARSLTRRPSARKKGAPDRPGPGGPGQGSTAHVLSGAGGLPLAAGVTAANTADIEAARALFMAIPAVRSRRGRSRRRPGKARADKGYDSADLRRWLRGRGITPRIARRGTGSSERLGRYRWKTGRTLAWLIGYRRLVTRYERHGYLFTAFLTLAAALTYYKKLAQTTT